MVRKVVIVLLLLPCVLWLLSWETDAYPEYCEKVDDCTRYNLLPFLFIEINEILRGFDVLVNSILAFSLAAITGALALYTARLYRATVQLGRDANTSNLRQHRMMNASVEEAARAATAAEISANATKYLAEADRAWVVNGRIDTEFVAIAYDEAFISVVVGWNNAGRTPAINASFISDHKIIGQGDPIPKFNSDHGSLDSRATLGQGVEFAADEVKVNATFFNDMLLGKWRLIVYSSVQYETLFKELGVRHSEVCFELTPHRVPPGTHWTNKNIGQQNSIN